jgi:hypothetical protein
MIPRAGFFLLLLIIPVQSYPQSERDLRSRIVIDGSAAEYTDAEWVIDAATRFPEPAGDSRWGLDNDVRRMAVTWDVYNLYLAVDCSATNTSVLLFIDCGCGGPPGLENDPFFRRNISFRDFTPNVIVQARHSAEKPEAVVVDCNSAPERLREDDYSAGFAQGERHHGALEVAIPWERIRGFARAGTGVTVPEEGYRLSICAAISGGDATGAGDAIPDPGFALSGDSTGAAVLDNFVTIPLDADLDRMLDVGVEPRGAATFALGSTAGSQTIPGIGVAVDKKAFAPGAGETLGFRVFFEGRYPLPVHVTVAVYSASGKLVRTVFTERVMTFDGGPSPAWDLWDGRDAGGSVVPGGVYLLTARCAETPSGTRSVAKEAIAVVR